MSYLHCPVCNRAFNLAQHPSCPSCPVAAAQVDPVAELVAAAESLARALAQATPAQRAAAAARIDRVEPGPGRHAGGAVGAELRSERRSESRDRTGPHAAAAALAEPTALLPIPGALAPAPPAAPKRSRWLAALAMTAFDRLSPHAPKRLVRAARAAISAFAA